MSDEAVFFAVAALVLLAAGIGAGRWLARRPAITLWPLLGALVAVALLLSLIGDGATAALTATLLWAAVVTGTALIARRLRPAWAGVLGVLGGAVAVQAAMIAFVSARFSAAEAPREYALAWLPAAMTGAVKRLGGPDDPDALPLWVRISQDAGVLPWLLVICTGLALAYVARAGQATVTVAPAKAP
ncbi:hypothetical protein GCM10009682_33380 [Luedemannella flava]|uniref:Uncharacterized protein n=1 Tax=Luedemannella flava TaxID=349316 RepID=A0ABP4YAF0_9ACTN